MNHKSIFLNILKCFIKDIPLSNNNLSCSDYNEILQLAKEHNLFALVYEKLLEDKYFSKECTTSINTINTINIVSSQTKRTHAFLDIYSKLSESNVNPITLKGIICRNLYGKYCDHRPSSDEDIYIPKQDFFKTKSILESNGYKCESCAVTSKQLDELQEVSFYNSLYNLTLEVHLNPIGHDNDLRKKMNSYFDNVFSNYNEITIGNVTIRTMDHTSNFLYLIFHAFRHFTTSGFGIRQVMDILLYMNQYYDKIDWIYIYNSLDETTSRYFLIDIIFIGNQFLGFNFKISDIPNCPYDLLDDLMCNGVFGNSTQAQRTATSMTFAAASKKKDANSLKTTLSTLFPQKKVMVNYHPDLMEKPWKLPVYWIMRIHRFSCHNKQNDGNLAIESLAISKKRINLLKKYRII